MRMRKIFKVLYVILAILLLLSTLIIAWLGFIGNTYHGENYFDLEFSFPTEISQAPGDTDYLYITEKAGIIKKVPNVRGSSDFEIFLDISDIVKVGGEDGLTGLEFHPNYPEVPKFYTFHSELQENSTTKMQTVLSSFEVDDNGQAIISSQEEILVNKLNSIYHRGGKLNFDPSGYLLVHIGDDATFFDAQNTTNLLGSILRIDVDNPVNQTLKYSIPANNPFVGQSGYREEIYAYGLRNPFRGDYDTETGMYYIGDVGAARMEEIDVLEPGNNYGWPYWEGTRCRWNCTDGVSSVLPEHDEPFIDYPHSLTSFNDYYDFSLQNRDQIYGSAIIGSNVYRGSIFDEFSGKMIITDYLGLIYHWDLDTQEVGYITRIPNAITSTHQLLESNELLFVGSGFSDTSGVIYELVQEFDFVFAGAVLLNSLVIFTPLIIKFRQNKVSDVNEQVSTQEDEIQNNSEN